MKPLRKLLDAQEIRCRAAEVRRNWTPAETLRRTGLPPDTPERLRDFILGRSTGEWRTAPQGSGRARREFRQSVK